jgi:DNA polymerase-3 subunit alpha
VNRSGVEFEVRGNAILYALVALKGVGRQAVEAIVEARANGPFKDLADFAARVNPRAVNKRVLESLAAAGAFDEFDRNRARVFAGVDTILRSAQHAHESASIGQNELFGGGGAREPIRLPNVEGWLPSERLKREYDAIGFFLSGHPLDDYAAVLKKLRVQPWAEFARAVKNGATAGRVAGTVVSRQERRTRTGNKMGIIGLSDASGAYEAVVFSEGLAEYRDLLEPGTAVLMFLSAQVEGDEVRARIQSVEPLDSAAANLAKGLRVFLRDHAPIEAVAKRLEPAPRANNGDGEVSVVLLLEQGTEVEVKLPGRFKVSPQIAGAIKAVPGVVQVEAL